MTVWAYFDCFSGISGDMTLGAFIDAGVPVERLQQDLARLPIEAFVLKAAPVERQGIRAMRCEVACSDSHEHRTIADIRRIIDESDLNGSVKTRAVAIFHKLAEAEAAVHGCPIEAVHFHEVGAMDAIVDIVGCCLCMAYLGVTQVAASALPQGRGYVDCRHGRLPLPAPATLALLKNVPVYGVDVEGELVTPTGAAIIAALGERFGPMPAMTVASVGYGAGQRTYDSHPNVLRVILGSPSESNGMDSQGFLTDTVHVIETTIDDMNPEIFGYLMEALFAKGALDVYWIPVYMKKNRPGILVQILSPEAFLEDLRDILFKETTTIGMRVSATRRWLLPRKKTVMTSSMGRVNLKRIDYPSGETRWVPEFEDCRRVAQEQGLSIRRVYEQIIKEAGDLAIASQTRATDR